MIQERVAAGREASEQRQIEPVEMQLRVNDAWRVRQEFGVGVDVLVAM